MAEHPLINQAIQGIAYPATRAQLVAQATQNHADAPTMQALNAIPDQQYANLEAVLAAARSQP